MQKSIFIWTEYSIRSFYFDSEEKIINAYKQAIETIRPKLSKIFEKKLLTKQILSIDIKPTPPGRGGIAYYESGSIHREGNN